MGLVHFAPEGVTVWTPQHDKGQWLVERDALGSWDEDLRGSQVQPFRGVISFQFVWEGEQGHEPPEFDPPARVYVAYTPADWRNKERETLTLCKSSEQGKWDEFPKIGDNEEAFKLVHEEDEPELGGLGIVKIEDPGDPRVGWY